MNDLLSHTLETGAITSVTTGLAIAACGQAELGNAVAPLNAVSHILWGDKAAAQDGLSAQFTLTGVALNSLAVTAWGAVHEYLCGDAIDRGDVVPSLLGGIAVAGVAYVIDYYLVPKRLTPGFEMRLSGKSLFGIYATLALSLALGRLIAGSVGG
jgi:hypothetical protein